MNPFLFGFLIYLAVAIPALLFTGALLARRRENGWEHER